MDEQLKTWYVSYPKCDWKTTFDVFLSPRILKAVESDENGLTYFIKGYVYEHEIQDYGLALQNYRMGAELLDSLSMFRLHEIYLGDANFGIAFDEKKSLCYLAFGSLLNQFEVFDKYSFWTKYEGLIKKSKHSKALIEEVLKEPPVEHFNWLSTLYTTVFKFVNNKENFNDIIPAFKALPFDKMKKTFYFILNGAFDFLAYAYNGDYGNSELLEFLSHLLELATSDLLFDNLFSIFISHLKILRIKKDFSRLFNRRIESNAFWIWTLAFQTTFKNYYLGELLQYEDALLDGDVDLKMNTSSWLNNYVGYCYEKGLGTEKNLEKSLELYERDILKMQRILFSRIRKIICLKEQDREIRLREMIDDVTEKTNERMHDYSRMDCYLYYITGKIAEKIEHDVDKAIELYKKGVDSDTYSCLKYHLFANETWRLRCLKRYEKLSLSKGIEIVLSNRRTED